MKFTSALLLLSLLPLASCLRTDTYDLNESALLPNVSQMPRLKEAISIDSSASGVDTSSLLRLEYDASGRLSRAMEIEFNHVPGSMNDTDYVLYTQFVYQGQDTVASEKIMTARDYTFMLMARPFATSTTHEYLSYANGYLTLDSALSVTDIGTLMYDTAVVRYTRSGNNLLVDRQHRNGSTPEITMLRRTFTGSPEMMLLIKDTSSNTGFQQASSYTETATTTYDLSHISPMYPVYKAMPGYGISAPTRPYTRLAEVRDKYLPNHREWNWTSTGGSAPGSSREANDYSYVFRADGALIQVLFTGTSTNFPGPYYGKDLFTYY